MGPYVTLCVGPYITCVSVCSLDALIHRGLFYELSRRNVSTADEMYCRAQEIDGKRAKDKYDQVNPKFTCCTSTKVPMLTLTRLMQVHPKAAYTVA